jgi:peptidoglycan/LPS O-acetylase OafA/YrhL
MKTKTAQKKERQYYIDWLRIFLILSVFLFHIGMIFNPWNWHIKNDVQVENLKYVMTFLSSWRMPLLFMISGVGTFFALGFRTRKQYLGERTKRLFLPLVAGIFILVPVQVYIERADMYDSLFAFYPDMFSGIYPEGNFSWHHLWFIAYLFVISLFISPLLNLIRRNGFEKMKTGMVRFLSKPYALNVFLIPMFVLQIVLRPYFPSSDQNLIYDWASFSQYLLFFLMGVIMLSNPAVPEIMRRQKWIFLVQSGIATALLFTVPYTFEVYETRMISWYCCSSFLAWSCSITVIGFGKQYLNFNSNLRRVANEAIYPFYLLHQPVIVVLGYYLIQWEMPLIMKAIVITATSFIITVAIYWYLVRPYNAVRIIFGMRPIKKVEVLQKESQLLPSPLITAPSGIKSQ